ncbi:hypothetical protein Fmac_026394 [Flemingia macrophylla]|uniref:Uncharacterized protein n=1 Tax=Flemingia macrophylla TaxID=520843 RepID=A0ABD1LER2_9FABA
MAEELVKKSDLVIGMKMLHFEVEEADEELHHLLLEVHPGPPPPPLIFGHVSFQQEDTQSNPSSSLGQWPREQLLWAPPTSTITTTEGTSDGHDNNHRELFFLLRSTPPGVTRLLFLKPAHLWPALKPIAKAHLQVHLFTFLSQETSIYVLRLASLLLVETFAAAF